MKNSKFKLKIQKFFQLRATTYELQPNRGFTLIELLIVMAIIGILAGFFSLNYITVRERARDAQRKSDMRQIQSALELYRSDVRTYPPGVTFGVSLQSGTIIYMQRVPNDPSAGQNYFYRRDAATGNYGLRVCLENDNDPQRDAVNSEFGANNPSLYSLPGCPAGSPSLTARNP